MKAFLKLIFILLGAFSAFIIFIIVLFSLAMRTFYTNYKSEITGIEVSEVRQIDFIYPREIEMLSDSTYPLVHKFSLISRDIKVSEGRTAQSFSFTQTASAAVDPGRVVKYSYSDSISKIKIYSVSKSDSTEITSDYKLTVFTSYSYDSGDSISCSLNTFGAWIMKEISGTPDRSLNFLLYRFRGKPDKDNSININLIFKSGRILRTAFLQKNN